MAHISFEEVKEILKKSIDETTNINEALEKTVQIIYSKGCEDGSRHLWIPCGERLPEDDEIVLVSDGIDYAVAFWRSDADAWDDPLHGWLDSFEFDVKAWMPLPEPYNVEKRD